MCMYCNILQIDGSYPEVSLAINEDLLNAGVLAVNLIKNDSGSGVKEVDLYKIMPGIVRYGSSEQQGYLCI